MSAETLFVLGSLYLMVAMGIGATVRDNGEEPDVLLCSLWAPILAVALWFWLQRKLRGRP